MYAKNKKLKKFLCLSAAAMLAFLMCAACLLVPAKGENGPCDTGDWAFAYISVGNDGDSSNPQGEYKTIYSASSKDISTVEGISYDRASNTLTIENYNNTKNRIAMNMMGDDFKINIKGENHIGELVSYGDGWGGSITLTGNGTLYINENKSYETAIYMNAENTKSVLTVGPECNVYVYSGLNAIVSSSNTTSDIIKAEGKLSSQLQTEVTHPVKKTMIFAGYFGDIEPWEGNVYTKEGDSAKYDCLRSTKSDGTVTFCYYELKKYDGFDKGYIGVKKEELSEKSSDYKMTDEIVKWYSADSLNGSTTALVKDTKTGKEAYAVVSKYDSATGNSKGYLCKIIANFGIDEYNQETCLVDIDNPVADIAYPNEYDVKLPDGYESVGEEMANIYNVSVKNEKVEFIGSSSTSDDKNNDVKKDEEVIELPSDDKTVKADDFNEIINKNQDSDVVINSNNDISFKFEKGTMNQVDGVDKYDFTTEVVKEVENAGTLPAGVTSDNFIQKIDFSYSGQLPAKAEIKIPVGTQYAGRTLYYSRLYDDGTIENIMSAAVDENGVITVEQDHCSVYLLTTTKLTQTHVSGSGTQAAAPNTGDSAPLAFMLLAVVISSFVLTVIGIVKKHKNSVFY
jgi:hypothetical protein